MSLSSPDVPGLAQPLGFMINLFSLLLYSIDGIEPQSHGALRCSHP
jgi:hypothetical protein